MQAWWPDWVETYNNFIETELLFRRVRKIAESDY